jgi:hypothetical protein
MLAQYSLPQRSKDEIEQNRQKAMALQEQRRREREDEVENEMNTCQSFCIDKCEIKARKNGWDQEDYTSKPYGVNRRESGRYHAEFKGKSESFCGCFKNEHEAAVAWDEMARSENFLFCNYPINNEISSRGFMNQLFKQFRSSGFHTLDVISIIVKTMRHGK